MSNGRAWFTTAMLAGLVHAAASLFWTRGGTWLLDTVGDFAVEMQEEGAASTRALLGAVTLAKAAGAVVPWWGHRSQPAPRWIRVASWAGAGVLLLWGGAGMLGAWAGLAGGGTLQDSALAGHALLWDPLFVLWGAALARGLWMTRTG